MSQNAHNMVRSTVAFNDLLRDHFKDGDRLE